MNTDIQIKYSSTHSHPSASYEVVCFQNKGFTPLQDTRKQLKLKMKFRSPNSNHKNVKSSTLYHRNTWMKYSTITYGCSVWVSTYFWPHGAVLVKPLKGVKHEWCHNCNKDHYKPTHHLLSYKVWMLPLSLGSRPDVTTSHCQVEFEQIVQMRKNHLSGGSTSL